MRILVRTRAGLWARLNYILGVSVTDLEVVESDRCRIFRGLILAPEFWGTCALRASVGFKAGKIAGFVAIGLGGDQGSGRDGSGLFILETEELTCQQKCATLAENQASNSDDTRREGDVL